EPGFGKHRGLGIAIVQGYFSDRRSLYCPSWTHPYFQYGKYRTGDFAGGWPEDDAHHADGRVQTNSSYHYRASRGIDGASVEDIRPLNLSRDLGSSMLFADHFSAKWAGIKDHHKTGYNATYLDGSGQFLPDPERQVELANNGLDYNAGLNGYLIQEQITQDFFEAQR
ncbi:MAG: hypothetical protein AAF085_17765, partial [Planctomycetota bacterium]